MLGCRRALWIIDSLKLGGAERLATRIAATPPPNWQVDIVALQPSPDRTSAGFVDGDRLHTLHMRHVHDLGQFRRLTRLIGLLRPDVVHTHLRYATLWGGFASSKLGLPYVTTLHRMPGPEPGLSERLLGNLERRAWRWAAQLVYVSTAQANAWGLSGCVVANGAEQIEPCAGGEREYLRRELNLPVDASIFLTVAVVRARKGWREWLQVAAATPNTHFVWVGGGPEFSLFKAEVRRQGLESRVRLTGSRDDVPKWLRTADVFLFPSLEEAMPTAVIEAMAAGLPVLALSIPAVNEVLGNCGWLVPPGNNTELVQAARQWSRPSDLRNSFGIAARDRFECLYSLSTWRQRLAALYDSVTRRPRILMVEFFSHGGLFHYSAQLAQGISRAGGSVTLLTGRHPECAPIALNEQVRLAPYLLTWNPRQTVRAFFRHWIRIWRGGLYMLAWIQVLRAAARCKPDVILFGDFEHRCDYFFVAHLRRRNHHLADIWHNVDVFNRWRGDHLVCQPAWRRHLARQFENVFVHGHALAAQLERRTDVSAVAINHGNQNWIQKQAGPDPDLRRRFHLYSQTPIALLFGNLTRYKGADVLIDALARMPATLRPVVLIAGPPSADLPIKKLHAQVRALGVEASMRWDLRYIPTSEVAWYFALASLVILPYRVASQSGVGHLALTFARPLLVTQTGGLPEIIDGNGLVVQPNDVHGLASALEMLVASPGLLRRMGERSAELVAMRHNWDSIGRRVLDALNSTHSSVTQAQLLTP